MRCLNAVDMHGLPAAVPGVRAAATEPVPEPSTANGKRKAISASRTLVNIDDDVDTSASKKVKQEKKPITAGRVIDIDDSDDEEVRFPCLCWSSAR
jgi:hypothetical protein